MDYCAPQLHLAAYHSEPGYRSSIPGIGVLCRDGDVILGAGIFHNSVDRDSVYMLAGYQPTVYKNIRVGAFGGFITGYRRGVMPWGAGAVSVGITPTVELHFTVIPRVENLTPLTVGLSISRRF